jgi:uncharacterized UBP type Zn finger protein
MNFYEEKINKIKIALGMEVKMAEAMLEDGVTKVEAEAFEPGKKIFVVSETGEKGPAPEGIHTTKDKVKVTVDANGTITAVEKPKTEELAENGEKKEEVKVEAAAEGDIIPPTGDAVNEPVKTEGDIMKEDMTKMIMQCMEAIEEVAKEVATVKEEMASYREKMEKMSATPAATKISTFNANPSEEKENTLDARVDHLRSLKASLKTNKKF